MRLALSISPPEPYQGHPQDPMRSISRYRGRPGIRTGGYPEAQRRLPGPRDPRGREQGERAAEPSIDGLSIRSMAPPTSRMAFRSSACRLHTSVADGSSLRWCSTRSSVNCSSRRAEVARLNGRPIHVSTTPSLDHALLATDSVGRAASDKPKPRARTSRSNTTG
jgi:hypothetical protein